MALITLSGADLAFGHTPLLDNAELQIEAGERVCLVGRNGAGKSTLLKVLNKEIPLDSGQLIWQPDLVVARLQQDPPREASGTVYEFVAEGVAQQAELLKVYHAALQQVAETGGTDASLQRLARLQETLEQQGAWQLDQRINEVLSQLGLQADAPLASLSGGWLRKAALGRALVSGPQVLLLDEPTNHLDIGAIRWLESFLLAFKGSLVFISHDRAFIRAMATRIVDLDRGQLVSWPGDYDRYLAGKEAALRVEETHNAQFDRRLAQEEAWIRQGIKARRTRNEGRVRALKALRQQRAQRLNVTGQARLQVEEAMRSGKIVFELNDVSYRVADKWLLRDFSAQVLRGDKIALIGPNGCGKTTLIKLLTGELQPTAGQIRTGTRLEIAYFDQHRAVLDPEKSVMDNLAEGRQEVMVNGQPRHVLGYLQEFLFPPERARTPVKAISGGERNRLLLARLFLKPSNLLILDEPTNDLDVETLELLEECVAAYQGTVLLVSHDRQFVDNTVTECWLFTGQGAIERLTGGYQDVLAWQARQQAAAAPIIEPAAKKPVRRAPPRAAVGLNYQQRRELEQLPAQLEQLEADIARMQQQISAADFFERPHSETTPVLNALAAAEQKLEALFARWEELESLQQEGK